MAKAKDFSHTFHVSKTSPYVKEAIILTLDINQTNPNKVLLFNFDLEKSDAYTFQRLDIEETDSYHQAHVHYVYLIYPLKDGKVYISFTLLKKVTTDDSVAYSFSGDRDNVKGLVTTDTYITLPPLQLSVKTLPKGTSLVGDFVLNYEIKKHQAQAYEPLPFQVSIKGKGYPPLLNTLLPKEGNFTRFTEKPIVKSIATKQGTQSTVSYPMALSHRQSFTLPAIMIKAFNPKTEKKYTLEVPSQDFDIQKVSEQSLLDKVDSPKALREDWSWVQTLLRYVIVFFAGYLTAISWRWKKKSLEKVRHPMIDKIENTKNEKALLQLLMATQSKQVNESIEALEMSLYGDTQINLKKIKQEILEKLR